MISYEKLTVSLNIAEEAGCLGKGEERHFYGIARASVMESAAICDIIYHCGDTTSARHRELKKNLRCVVAMLSKMVMNLSD